MITKNGLIKKSNILRLLVIVGIELRVMRRGRGKGKKQNAIGSREDQRSGDEEKIPPYRRRGRPQKPLKDEIEIEEEEIVTKEDDTNSSIVTSKEDVLENENKKRKKPLIESKESNISEEENGLGSKSSTDDSLKSSLSIGFRQNGSRRKNKPRRAAESVVECNGI